MPNFRVIYDNAANRAALSVSTSASAALGAANLLTDRKGEVWRAGSTSGTITAEWTAAQTLAGVALPYTNLGPNATIRVQAYTLPADTTPAYDSGAVLACPGILANQLEGSQPAGVNAYSYAGAACARLWFPSITVRKVLITLADSGNPAGYIEAGRLVCGRYWEGQKNVDYGASLTAVDRTELSRNDAGDLVADVGTTHRKISVSLSNMALPDRNALWNILWGNGKRRPVFFSLFPGDSDTAAEQQHQIYCRLSSSPAMNLPSFLQYSSSLEFEEI